MEAPKFKAGDVVKVADNTEWEWHNGRVYEIHPDKEPAFMGHAANPEYRCWWQHVVGPDPDGKCVESYLPESLLRTHGSDKGEHDPWKL